jgi:hypothetical protein
MSCIQNQRIYHCDSEFDESETIMQFRLTYEGPLKPSGNNTKYGAHKHEIRKAFHPQLKQLWACNRNLSSIAEMPYSLFSMPTSFKPIKPGSVMEHLTNEYPLQDYRFVPLVTEALSLWCGLDILFLRPSSPGNIFSAGDIDNRIKTLFDALKRPSQLSDLGPTYLPPDPDENPFFVLLEDDALVAKLTVETDTMLEPIVGGMPDRCDARLIITVTLRPDVVTPINIPFG